MAKLYNFWCHVCCNIRIHVGIGNTEQATCKSCGSVNWRPMGHID